MKHLFTKVSKIFGGRGWKTHNRKINVNETAKQGLNDKAVFKMSFFSKNQIAIMAFVLILILAFSSITQTGAEVRDNLNNSIMKMLGVNDDTITSSYEDASINAKLNYLVTQVGKQDVYTQAKINSEYYLKQNWDSTIIGAKSKKIFSINGPGILHLAAGNSKIIVEIIIDGQSIITNGYADAARFAVNYDKVKISTSTSEAFSEEEFYATSQQNGGLYFSESCKVIVKNITSNDVAFISCYELEK